MSEQDIITVEYWPNTGQWRICVAGVAVGYWLTEDEAELRARQARRALAGQSSDQGANISVRGAHRFLGALCEAPGCISPRSGRSPYCKKHDMRYRRHGDPLLVLPRGRKKHRWPSGSEHSEQEG